MFFVVVVFVFFSFFFFFFFFVLFCFVVFFPSISGLTANSVNPDQTPRSAASDPGLHCHPIMGR